MELSASYRGFTQADRDRRQQFYTEIERFRVSVGEKLHKMPWHRLP